MTDTPLIMHRPTARRIQRLRRRGWRMPSGTIYVGCGSRWSNPYRVGELGIPDAHVAVAMFVRHTLPTLDLRPLCGHDLACWCPLDTPCHADWLLFAATLYPPNDETRDGHAG